MKHFIFGDYVFTGIPNAFNNKIGYWISKKYYTRALYCFSVNNEKEAARHLDKHGIESYISFFDSQHKH